MGVFDDMTHMDFPHAELKTMLLDSADTMIWRSMANDPPPPDLHDIIGWARYSGIHSYHRTVGAGWIGDDPNLYDAELWLPLPAYPERDQWPPEPVYDD
jgi:hypothetical protein